MEFILNFSNFITENVSNIINLNNWIIEYNNNTEHDINERFEDRLDMTEDDFEKFLIKIFKYSIKYKLKGKYTFVSIFE